MRFFLSLALAVLTSTSICGMAQLSLPKETCCTLFDVDDIRLYISKLLFYTTSHPEAVDTLKKWACTDKKSLTFFKQKKEITTSFLRWLYKLDARKGLTIDAIQLLSPLLDKKSSLPSSTV